MHLQVSQVQHLRLFSAMGTALHGEFLVRNEGYVFRGLDDRT